jgi:hypothetical protein
MDIRRFDIQQVLLHLDALTGLLQDAVDHGASIGFYPPPLAVQKLILPPAIEIAV